MHPRISCDTCNPLAPSGRYSIVVLSLVNLVVKHRVQRWRTSGIITKEVRSAIWT
ncbi:hypothetical protein [Rhodococcus sp. OK302]|uniref:hypothetical protein n=1 Tax=Rhodococcus sp. OK302 TaxID=1882769 RepID=UPI0015952F65|nr:hypothetical protein [Rhodococcus sp. OK302]